MSNRQSPPRETGNCSVMSPKSLQTRNNGSMPRFADGALPNINESNPASQYVEKIPLGEYSAPINPKM